MSICVQCSSVSVSIFVFCKVRGKRMGEDTGDCVGVVCVLVCVPVSYVRIILVSSCVLIQCRCGMCPFGPVSYVRVSSCVLMCLYPVSV